MILDAFRLREAEASQHIFSIHSREKYNNNSCFSSNLLAVFPTKPVWTNCRSLCKRTISGRSRLLQEAGLRLRCRALWVNTTETNSHVGRSGCTRLLCSSPSVLLHAAPPQAKEGNKLLIIRAQSLKLKLNLNQNIHDQRETEKLRNLRVRLVLSFSIYSSKRSVMTGCDLALFK